MEWLEAFLHRPSCRKVLQQETCVPGCVQGWGRRQEAHHSAGLCPPAAVAFVTGEEAA